MSVINLDAVPEMVEQVVLKPGQYTLRVTEAKRTVYEKDGEQRERVDMSVEVVAPATIVGADGSPQSVAGVNWKESFYFTEKSLPMVKKNLSFFGVTGPIDTELLPSQLHGKSAKAFVSVSAKGYLDENTGANVVDEETGKPIQTVSYRARWIAKA